MTFAAITDTVSAMTYRWAQYAVNTLMDDPAMLAFIFC
jgi:hypothetical protein